jgi:hypothetical protein
MQAWLGWPNAPSVKKKPKRVGLLAQAHALGMSFFFFFQGTNNLSSSPNIFNKQKRLRVACWPSFKRPTGHQKFRQRVYPQKRLDFQLIFFYPKHLKNSLYTLKNLSMASNNPNSDPKTQNQP